MFRLADLPTTFNFGLSPWDCGRGPCYEQSKCPIRAFVGSRIFAVIGLLVEWWPVKEEAANALAKIRSDNR